MKLWSLVLLLSLSAVANGAEPLVTSSAVGIFDEEQKVQLVPAFTNAVYEYLRHYEPTLVTQEAEYAKLRVDYDFDYDVELMLKANVYQVKVTLAQKTHNRAKAQKQAAHLAAGVFKSMQKTLTRRVRAAS